MNTETPLTPQDRLRYEAAVSSRLSIWTIVAGVVCGGIAALIVYNKYQKWWAALIAWGITIGLVQTGFEALLGSSKKVKGYSDAVLRHEYERGERRNQVLTALKYVGGGLFATLMVIGWWVGPQE